MLAALVILIFGLTPSLLSLWAMRRANNQAQARLQLAMHAIANHGLSRLRLEPDQHYVEGIGYLIGDITCQFNARSSYIRCAVNPLGTCRDCSDYQPKEFEPQ